MARIEGCLISVEVAARLAELLKKECPTDAFRCPHCHQPVRPQMGPGTPHFEHKQGNKGCLLSN